MGIKPRSERLGAILSLAPAGQRDKIELAPIRACAEAPDRFIAVNFRHAYVDQNDIRIEGGEDFDTGLPIVDNADLGSKAFQQNTETVGDVMIVVDYEHALSVVGCFRRVRIPRSLKRRGAVERKPNDEHATLAGTIALRVNFSAVHLNETARQGESDAKAAALPR